MKSAAMPSPSPSSGADPGFPSGKPAPFWKIWANPIFRRYCRSRLRPRGLGFSLLVTLIVASFAFFLSRALAMNQGDLPISDAERIPIFPLLGLQGFILFILGTGQVAGGMTAEADEGVIDYQRLAPMTPLAKVLGYLFGLPVREYVCFLSTLPFVAWSVWRGGIDPVPVLTLYGVILSSTILYHLTGLVAGTVLKNRRWAFLLSMGLVFLLYTVMPQISKFGLAYFHYFTVEPVFVEFLPELLPRDAAAAVVAGRNLMGETRFFNLELPEAVFTVLSQGVLILTLIMMIWRRWRRAETHLLGKIWATGLFGWIQVVLIGNALPLIEPGLLFPSRELMRRYGFIPGRMRDWQPEPSEAVLMAGAFGFVSLIILWTFTTMITPNAETQLRGWRRSRKLGRKTLPLASDPSTAFWWVALMAIFGAAGWFVFARAIVESRWFPGQEVPLLAIGAFGLVFLTGSLGFHALLEGKGSRTTALTTIFAGVVPILVGTILGVIGGRLVPLAVWIGAASPASGPAFGSATVLPVSELPLSLMRAVPRAFWFWQGVGVLVAACQVVGLYQSRKAIAQAATEDHDRGIQASKDGESSD